MADDDGIGNEDIRYFGRSEKHGGRSVEAICMEAVGPKERHRLMCMVEDEERVYIITDSLEDIRNTADEHVF